MVGKNPSHPKIDPYAILISPAARDSVLLKKKFWKVDQKFFL